MVGVWSKLGYVKNSGVKAVTTLLEVKGEEAELCEDWDVINVG
jgi:hypothetical protein